MNTGLVSGRVKRLILVLSASGSLLVFGAISASAAPARSAAPAAIPAAATCGAHDWCAFADYDFNIGNSGATEWIWSSYSYNTWYYVGSAENDKWYSWISSRGWTTGIGLNYPVSHGSGAWACVTGGDKVAYPGDYPGTSTSEVASVSSINFFNTSTGVACP